MDFRKIIWKTHSKNYFWGWPLSSYNWNGPQSHLGPWLFWAPRNLGPEKFGPQEVWFPRNMGPKKFGPHMKIITWFFPCEPQTSRAKISQFLTSLPPCGARGVFLEYNFCQQMKLIWLQYNLLAFLFLLTTIFLTMFGQAISLMIFGRFFFNQSCDFFVIFLWFFLTVFL